MPWIIFDSTRLFLTIPQDVNGNAQIVIVARHMDHNVMNVISFDFIIDNTPTYEAKGKRLSHIMSNQVFRHILGACLAVSCVIIIVRVYSTCIESS